MDPATGLYPGELQLPTFRRPSKQLSTSPTPLQRTIQKAYIGITRCVSEISKTTNDQPTQLYFIRTTQYVSDRWIHHQVHTDLKFISKCNL